MEKMTLEEFRHMKSLLLKGNYQAHNKLFTYDLSDIPFEEWEGVHLCLMSKDLSFSRPNLDFSLLDNNSYFDYVCFKNCNLKNLISSKNRCTFSSMHSSCFDDLQKQQYKELFIEEENVSKILNGYMGIKEYRKLRNNYSKEISDFACRKNENVINIFSNFKDYTSIVDENLDDIMINGPLRSISTYITTREEYKKYLLNSLNDKMINRLSIANLYGLTKYFNEEELFKNIFSTFYCFSDYTLFYKCGIENLYALSKKYDSFLDEIPNGYNSSLRTFQYIAKLISNTHDYPICNEDYIEQYKQLQQKDRLESVDEVYTYFDLLFKIFYREEYSYTFDCISALYKAFPQNFVTKEEINGIVESPFDTFHFYDSFYKKDKFNLLLKYAHDNPKFYDLLKTKNIMIPKKYQPYYNYLDKEQLFPILVEYAYGVDKLPFKKAELYFTLYNIPGISSRSLIDYVMYAGIKDRFFDYEIIKRLPESVRKNHPEVFLNTEDEDINISFYDNRIDAFILKEHPEIKDLFLHVDFGVMFQCSWIDCSADPGSKKNIYQILETYLSKEEILDLMINFGVVFDATVSSCILEFPTDFTKEEMMDIFYDSCRVVIKRHAVFDHGDITGEFKEKNQDLYLSEDAPKKVKEDFYHGTIDFKTFASSYEMYIPYIIGKDPFFFKNDYETDFVIECIGEYDIPEEELYKLIGKYGEYMKAELLGKIKWIMDKNNFISYNAEEKIEVMEKNIIDILYTEFINQNLDLNLNREMFSLFNQIHPNLVLGEEVNASFKNSCYSHVLEFSDLLRYPTIDIKNKEYTSYFLYKDSVRILSEKLGTDQLFALALKNEHNASVIDTMMMHEKANVLVSWYDKHRFLPDASVMLNMDINASDKFLANGRKWSKLMHYTRPWHTYEYKEALFKASMIFGVFDHDDKGYNAILELFTLPKTIDEKKKEDIKRSIRYIAAHSCLPHQILSLEEKVMQSFNELYKNNALHYTIYSSLPPEELSILKGAFEKEGLSLSGEEVHQIFGGMDVKYQKEFREFFLRNLEYAKKEGELSKFSKIERSFNKIRAFNAGRKLTFATALDYIANVKYANIERGNIHLASLASKSSYSEENYKELEEIYSYTKKRTTSSIPRVFGQVDNYSYEIVRLDDPIALVIGELTDCCQELNDAARSSMIHSATDKDGRVFVVRAEDGSIIAQSWVWRKNDTICFDNIEIPQKVQKTNDVVGKVLEVYRKAASLIIEKEQNVFEQLYKKGKITKEEKETLVVDKVTVGLGYNDIADTIRENLEEDYDVVYPTSYTSVIDDDSYLYIDSKNQYILGELERKKKSTSTHENIYPYYDTFEIYKSDMPENKKEVLKDLMEEYIYTYDEDILSEIAEEYAIGEDQIRVLMNYNFAMICDELNKETIEIKDVVLDKDNVSCEVREQIGYAIETLENHYQEVKYDDVKHFIENLGKDRKKK